MKILHIISQHPESTGSGFYLQNIMRQAAEAGHRNGLVAGITGNRFPNLNGMALQHSAYVSFGGSDLDFTIPGMSDVMPYASSRFSKLSGTRLSAYERAFADKILHLAEQFRPDVVHSHHLWLVTAVARRVLPSIPMVTSCHSTDLRQFVQCPHLQKNVLKDCRKVDRVLALSGDQAIRIQELYGIDERRVDCIGGGYDDALFTLNSKQPPPPIHLLYAGKLSFAKGVDWLLRTISGLQETDLHLHLAGSGSGREAEHCLALAGQSTVAMTVHGRMSQPELAALMGRCHVFILPSFYEGLPLVLLEALASGCRVITTDLPGCRELLETAGPDLVEMVELPKMQSIDRPYPGDQGMLDARLGKAVSRMAERVRKKPSPNPESIGEITRVSRWDSIFQKVQRAYQSTVES